MIEEFLVNRLTSENEMMVALYNKIIDPMNNHISWSDYFLLCEMDDYPNWKDGQDIILHIREAMAKYHEDKSKHESDTKLANDENQERIRRVK